MEMAVNYNSLCAEFNEFNKKALNALIYTLNNRGVESINVKTYMDNDLIDWFTFPQTDKNGYGVNVKIDTIRKDEDGDWVADVVNEVDEDWGELELTTWNFDAGALIDILGIVEGIFATADEDYDGKVYAEGEDIEEDYEDEEDD